MELADEGGWAEWASLAVRVQLEGESSEGRCWGDYTMEGLAAKHKMDLRERAGSERLNWGGEAHEGNRSLK